MDLDDLQARLESKISDGRSNPIGYGGGDLTGVSLADADVMRSPCRALRWAADNSIYTYETFVRLSDTQGWQGINVYTKDGTLYRKIEVQMGGGINDSDPMKIIYINNRAILMELIQMVAEDL
jgi:hypothetical protein